MSQSAAAYFGEQGFEEAYSMDGGFSDWEVNFTDKIEAGQSIVTKADKKTLIVGM
jgi:rhodanese-related sulfurtransferase